MMVIEVKRLKDVPMPKKIVIGSWVDLVVSEDIILRKGDTKYIPLGVAMKLPDGYEALVVPRSSTFKKYGVLMCNSIGVIDSTYCGNNDEWHFPVYASRTIFIPKGTAICQFRIIKEQPLLQFVEVEKLTYKDRGGLGSTGDYGTTKN